MQAIGGFLGGEAVPTSNLPGHKGQPRGPPEPFECFGLGSGGFMVSPLPNLSSKNCRMFSQQLHSTEAPLGRFCASSRTTLADSLMYPEPKIPPDRYSVKEYRGRGLGESDRVGDRGSARSIGYNEFNGSLNPIQTVRLTLNGGPIEDHFLSD